MSLIDSNHIRKESVERAGGIKHKQKKSQLLKSENLSKKKKPTQGLDSLFQPFVKPFSSSLVLRQFCIFYINMILLTSCNVATLWFLTSLKLGKPLR